VSYGILLLRVVLGLTMAGHGAQKLFGSFGGPGLDGVAGWLRSMRFRPARMFAVLVGLCEFGGGVLLALGLVTPLAALAIVSTMIVAIALVHREKGFWNGQGGYEFNLLIAAAATALAATGGGRFSLDDALGWWDNLSGLWWGVGVVVVGALGAAAAIALGRRPEPASRERRDGLRAA